MSIKAQWLARGVYFECWEENVNRLDVINSSIERGAWFQNDKVSVYVVIINLDTCTGLPTLASLRESASIHPRGYVHFILVTQNTLFRTIGVMVTKITGYYIISVSSLQDALSMATKIVDKNVPYSKIKV